MRARALKAVSEMTFEESADVAASLAVPLLQDENEEIRYSALAVLEKNPNESYFPDVLQMARTAGGRVMEASFGALKKLLATAKQDHTPEIVPLLADGNALVRAGTVSLLLPYAPDVLARRILEHFRGSYVWVRDRAVETARDGLPGFVNALLKLTRDPDTALAKAASEMTLALADAKALPVWVSLVDDKDIWVKTRALETLGRLGRGEDAVLGRVLAALKDPELVIPAASALGDLADPRAAQPLLDAFKAAVTQPDIQMEILDAMSKLAIDEKMLTQIAGICSRVAQMPALDGKVREKARRLVGDPQGDRGARRPPEDRGRGPDASSSPATTRRGSSSTSRTRSSAARRTSTSRPGSCRTGASRGSSSSRRARHVARPRLAAHPRGPARGRLEEARARAPDRRLPEAPGPRPLPRELLLAARGLRRVLQGRPEDDPDDRGDRPPGRDRLGHPEAHAGARPRDGAVRTAASPRRSRRSSTGSTRRGPATSSRSRTPSSSSTRTRKRS